MFPMRQLERAKYREINESFRAQGKYGKMPGRKADRTSWKDSSKLDRPFSPVFFRIFTGCFASCLAAKGRRARKRQLCSAVLYFKRQREHSVLFYIKMYPQLGSRAESPGKESFGFLCYSGNPVCFLRLLASAAWVQG